MNTRIITSTIIKHRGDVAAPYAEHVGRYRNVIIPTKTRYIGAAIPLSELLNSARLLAKNCGYNGRKTNVRTIITVEDDNFDHPELASRWYDFGNELMRIDGVVNLRLSTLKLTPVHRIVAPVWVHGGAAAEIVWKIPGDFTAEVGDFLMGLDHPYCGELTVATNTAETAALARDVGLNVEDL